MSISGSMNDCLWWKMGNAKHSLMSFTIVLLLITVRLIHTVLSKCVTDSQRCLKTSEKLICVWMKGRQIGMLAWTSFCFLYGQNLQTSTKFSFLSSCMALYPSQISSTFGIDVCKKKTMNVLKVHYIKIIGPWHITNHINPYL